MCLQELSKKSCEMCVSRDDGAVMSAHHSLVVTITNNGANIVVIPPKTRMGHCKVKDKSAGVNTQIDAETTVLGFLWHYFKVNKLDGVVYNAHDDTFVFGHHFNASIEASHKVSRAHTIAL